MRAPFAGATSSPNAQASNGQNAVSLAVTKKSSTNTLELVDRIKADIDRQNAVLTDDQTVPTRNAIGVMQTNALYGVMMLLPGIIGKFMFVIPFVVTLALLISLVEAFWMMPVHVIAIGVRFDRPSRMQAWRERFNRGIRLRYGQLLGYVLRRPKRFAVVGTAAVAVAVALLVTGVIRIQFFAFDPIRAFYVNVDMPPSASLEDTLAATQRVEQVVRGKLRGVGLEGEARAVTSTAGLKFTDTEPIYGELYGQVFVSLNPRQR